MLAHPAAEIDKGAGIAMCCTFGDLTDVLWWRELQLPTRSVITRNGRLQAEVPEWLAGGPGERAVRRGLAGKTTFGAREAVVAALRESRRPRRRADAHPAQGQLLRARREAARDRHLAAVVHPQRRPRRRRSTPQLIERGRGDRLPPRVHARALRELGRRPQRRLAGLPPALLRRADPGLVPARRRRRARLRPPDRARRGPSCPSTRRPSPRPATPSPSAASPAASSATPTSWTPGRPRR